MPRDSKELFVQRFAKVFDQNSKHVEAQNKRADTAVDFPVPWWDCQKQPPKVLHKKAILKNCAIFAGNTCVGVYFLKSCRTLDLQLYHKKTPKQVLSCEYCRIFNTTSFEKHLQTVAF